MVQEEAFDDDALHDQVERVDRDRPSAHVGIDNEDPMLAERAGDHGAALTRNSVDGERHATVSDGCRILSSAPSSSTTTRSPPTACSSGMSSGRRTRLIVFMPRALAMAISDRPTPELAAFWTIQSPGLRSDASSRSRDAVGGLMPSIASCCGSASGRLNRPVAGTTNRSRQLKA